MKIKQLLSMMLTIIILACVLLIFPVSATQSWDWSKPRPAKDRYFKETIGKDFTDGEASVGLGVTINKYEEDLFGFGYDAIGLNISVSGNTRVGINYYVFDWGDYYWYDASRLTNIVGDDGGAWFELGLNFFFYGVKYRRVWVCSNGFLCFDSEATDRRWH